MKKEKNLTNDSFTKQRAQNTNFLRMLWNLNLTIYICGKPPSIVSTIHIFIQQKLGFNTKKKKKGCQYAQCHSI